MLGGQGATCLVVWLHSSGIVVFLLIAEEDFSIFWKMPRCSLRRGGGWLAVIIAGITPLISGLSLLLGTDGLSGFHRILQLGGLDRLKVMLA